MNEHTEIPSDLHVKLCASLFGEADAGARAEVEAALAADPAVRAERDRLLASIGAVRAAFPAGDALSAPARDRLLARAAAPRPPARRWLAPLAAAALVAASALRLADAPSAPIATDQRAAADPQGAAAERGAEALWFRAQGSAAVKEPALTPAALGELVAQVDLGPNATPPVPGLYAMAPPTPASAPEPPAVGLTFSTLTVAPAASAAPPARAPAAVPPAAAETLLGFAYWSGSGGSEAADAHPLDACARLPGERPQDMFFRFFGDNAFVLAELERLSTFGADVDTASYALARSYLLRGVLPEKAQVRTEEFLNYFRPDLPPPDQGTFRLRLDAGPSPYGGAAGDGEPTRWLLRAQLRGRVVAREQRPPQRLTFVVDTSGSMKQDDRLGLVQHALRLLCGELDARDRVAIVRFASAASLVLPPTPCDRRAELEAAIQSLAADGSTNAEAGLRLGYAQAAAGVDPEAISRVVLLSDGVANVGVTDQERIARDVAEQRALGILLNTVGVGMGNHNDVFLEQLADRGDGICNYVDSAAEARRALVDQFTGAFVPIARDVKLQVEFDPAQVGRWRLLGYENRALAAADFRNDAVDAGELGAGHQVTALYEIEPTARGLSRDAALPPFATLRARWKAPPGAPDAGLASETAAALCAADVAAGAGALPPGFRRAAVVAEFAEILRRSRHAANGSLDLVLDDARRLQPELAEPAFDEFVDLVDRSRALVAASAAAGDPIADAVDAVRRNRVLRAELEDLARAEDRDLLDDLERQNRALEERLKRLLEEREQRGGR